MFTEEERRFLIHITQWRFDETVRHIGKMDKIVADPDSSDRDVEWAQNHILEDYEKMAMYNSIVAKLEQ